MKDLKIYQWSQHFIPALYLEPQDRIEAAATSTQVWVVTGKPKAGPTMYVTLRKGNHLGEVFGERLVRTYQPEEFLTVFRLDKNLSCPQCGEKFETVAWRKGHQVREGHALAALVVRKTRGGYGPSLEDDTYFWVEDPEEARDKLERITSEIHSRYAQEVLRQWDSQGFAVASLCPPVWAHYTFRSFV